MFDSFSASFPSRNTHPIRNLVNLLSMSHRFGYFCNEIHVAVHSLRQVHSTGHSECVFVVRRDLLLSLWRAQSLGVSASRFPSRGSWPAFLSVHCTLVQLGYNLWPPVSVWGNRAYPDTLRSRLHR